MSCIAFCLNRQDMWERWSLKFAQQVEWGVGKNILAVNLVPWLVDIISLGNSSAVLSWVILSPISQLSLIASQSNGETNYFSACPICSPSPGFIVSMWNQSHHLSSAWTEERERGKTSRLPLGDILRILALWYKWWIPKTKNNNFKCLFMASSSHVQYCNIQRWK